MKIAWLHSHLLMGTGGTKFIYEVTRRIARQAELTLYCEQAKVSIRQMFESGGVAVRTFGRRTSTSAAYWLFLRAELRRELAALRQLVPAGAAVVSSMFPMNVLANGLSDRAVQYCFEPFAFFFSRDMISGLPAARRAFCRMLRRRHAKLDIDATRRSAAVVTLNKITRGLMRNTYGVESSVSLAGVDCEFFKPTPDEALSRSYAGEKIIMHGTDFSPVKASDLVVRAMPAILREVPTARLLISNTYEDRRGKAALAALAARLGVADRVTFLGFLQFADVPKYYTLADVVIQPAYAVDAGTSSMNLAVKEAMACQTPVIRADMTDEDAVDGVSGYLTPPGDFEAIARSAVKVLRQPHRKAEMGAAGRARILEMYNWDRTAEAIFKVIREEEY